MLYIDHSGEKPEVKFKKDWHFEKSSCLRFNKEQSKKFMHTDAAIFGQSVVLVDVYEKCVERIVWRSINAR